MSSLLSAELSATCNALGTYNKKSGKYMIDEFSLNTVKDLIRYLRRDGEDHEIRRHLGQTKVLQTDLLPMLIDHWENTDLFDVTLRLIVNLTNPALLLYREEVPVERTARHNYLQILNNLQSYKEEAFTKVETWQVFSKKLAKVLEIDWAERDEDTGLIIERILILIRNVLHVPADLDKERRPENDASVHDQVLWALNQSGILDIILYMSSENEKQYFMHILEIISHLLREQNPTSLSNAALQRSMDEKLRDEQELLTIRMTETKARQNKIKQYSATRHSRFGGTYVVQNMKSISDNEIICLKPLNKISSLDFNGSKKSKLVKPKNRRPVESGAMERRSAFAVRLFLKEFCIEFLNSSYNPLMRYVKDVLVRAKAQQNDESYYLWAVKFFMEFNRGHKFQVGLVSETMSVPMFHYVQQQMEKYYDMIKVEKKKFSSWVRRLHIALKAYKELLYTLVAMDKSTDVTVRESAKVLKSNIFYVLEYREFILTTFLSYDENKMPRSYLEDLVETVHLFLKMLEHYCKRTGLVVQKKVRKKSKAKKTKQRAQKSKSAPIEIPPWEDIRPQIACVLGTVLEDFPPPFDAASDVPIDQQKEDCMKKIQKVMREGKYEDAVGTFRAAREVWPEEGIFGAIGIAEDEELDMLQTIYNTDLGVEITEVEEEEGSQDEMDNEEEEDEEEEDEHRTAVVETDFDFQDFVQRFCQARVVNACATVLETAVSNSARSVRAPGAALKILHRLACDCRRPALMFQATLFITFQRVFNNPLPHLKVLVLKILHRFACDCLSTALMFQATLFITFQRVFNNPLPHLKCYNHWCVLKFNASRKVLELERFGIYIFRKFAAIASKSPKAFIELLFWKSSKDAIEIEHGYDLYTDQKDKLGKGVWTEEQEDELRNLFMENQINPTTEKDVIDWILENLIDQTRTRRGVIKKLKELGLIFKAPTKKSNKARLTERVPKDFSEEEDNLLAELWHQYSDTPDPLGLIIPRMPRKRSKRSYVERLLELGIIKDKKECRKKRQRHEKSKPTSDDDNDTSGGSSSESESSARSDSDDNVKTRLPLKAKKLVKKAEKKKPEKRNKPKKEAELSANEIAKLLVQAVDNDHSEALRWLAENLEEVALDQEAEGYDPEGEGTPLVPVGEASAKAMDDEMFLKVLKGVGMAPPADEQETYWRIPSHLHHETIRKRREIIIRAVNKELVVDETLTPSNDITEKKTLNDNESSDDDDLFDNLRKLRRNQENDDNTMTESITKVTKSNMSRKRSRSTDDEDREKKMPKIDESEEQNDEEEDILSFAKKTLEIDEPETEDILSNIRRHDTDDSEDEENEEIVTTKRKRTRVLIDDDSD